MDSDDTAAASSAPAASAAAADPAPPPPPPRASDSPGRSSKARKAAETVANVAYAFRHRDEIVENALDLLSGTGIIDPMQRERIQELYRRGDARTRLFIQDLVSRILRVPLERVAPAAVAARIDPDRMPSADLAVLQGLAVGRLDPGAVADRVRSLDVESWLGGVKEPGRVLTLLSDAPVWALRLRRRLLALGIVLFLIALAGFAFPDYAAVIALYSFLTLIALLAAYLAHWSWRIDRAAKALDIDLSVYAKLAPDERRILVGRRVLLKLVDTDQLGDLVERGLRSVMPSDPPAARPPTGSPSPNPRPTPSPAPASAPGPGSPPPAESSPQPPAPQRPRPKSPPPAEQG